MVCSYHVKKKLSGNPRKKNHKSRATVRRMHNLRVGLMTNIEMNRNVPERGIGLETEPQRIVAEVSLSLFGKFEAV